MWQYCPDCDRKTEWGAETIGDPAATHRQKEVAYCKECGEVV